MVPASEYFRSVELIWPLWLASVALLALLTYRCLARFHWTRFRRLLRKENGAAYSLAYVMTVPIYMLLVCLVVETSLILVVKIGTVYAGFAAARSAAVWWRIDARVDDSKAQQRVQWAAIHALVPFGDGNPAFGAGGPVPSDANDFFNTYLAYAGGSGTWIGSKEYITRKYRCVAKGLHPVQLTQGAAADPTDPTHTTPTVKATVTYDSPLMVPVIARLFAALNLAKLEPNGKFYVYPITTTVTLTQEAIKDVGTPEGNPVTRPYGISYSPLPEDGTP